MFSVNKNKEIFTNKLINGETICYTFVSLFCVVVFFALKQFLKLFISLSAPIAVLTAFIIVSILSYLLERRFVFRKKVLSSNLKQILLLIFRTAVDYGFYKIFDTIFEKALDMSPYFVWIAAIITSLFFNYFFSRMLLFDCAYNPEEIKYSRTYIFFFSNRFVFASMGIAALCLAVIYIIFTVFPFGDSTLMRMDLYHQYGPLFAELYDRVINHQSFLYSWESGGGSSFLGNYFNYLSSPLSALIFLFDKEDISLAITFIISIKCILSAGSFTYYIKHSVGTHSYISSAFGIFYAFCAYFLAYYWNVMWIDGMILLPIIALGIERIINHGKARTYIISLTLLFLSSYYMGFMACIFSVIYFIGYFVISSSFSDKINPDIIYNKKYSFKALMNNKFFNRGIRFAFGSVICAALCAFELIPVFLILKSCSATSDTFPTTFESYFNIFDFLTSHLADLEETIRSSGDDVLPNVYSGIITIILLPLFVINKDIRFKEKASYIIMLLFFLFSFDNNMFNFVWHAMHFPNDLPFRFSFMYSFLLLVIGFKSIVHIKAVNIKDICFVGMAWIFFICIAQKMATTKMAEPTIYISIAFVIIWTAFLYLLRKGTLKKALLSASIIVFAFCEVITADTASFVVTQNNEDYKINYSSYREAIDYINDNDDGFFRSELCYLETRMDPCYYGYNGMSVFSSMAYESYSRLQYSLGMFGNRINSYTYNTQTPVYNMMFNIKYLMQTDVSLKPSDNLYTYKYTTVDQNTNVYQSNYYLPIAYCVNSDIENWDTEEGNPFRIQNDFVSLAAGYSDVFKEVEYLETQYDELSGDEFTQNGTYWFNKIDSDSTYGYADITFTASQNGNIYIYVTSPDVKSIEVNSNRIASHTQSIEEPYILDIGYHEAGDEVTVSIDGGGMETSESYVEFYAYSLDEAVLNNAYKKLSDSSIQITSFNETEISGTISCDNNSYLYTSIPYDEGWSVYIDGEKCKTFEIGNSMLSVAVKPGEHNITLKYTPKGIKVGTAISAATLICLAGFGIFEMKRKRKNKPVK